MSLWKIPDLQTKMLMVMFYRFLIEQKLSRSRALRQAQLELKREFPHPLFWGAFICQGEVGELSQATIESIGKGKPA
jgi:CHAT domain-containing protein